MMFVPKTPLEAMAKLECDTETVFVVNTKNVISQQRALEISAFMKNHTDELIMCKVSRIRQETIKYLYQ